MRAVRLGLAGGSLLLLCALVPLAAGAEPGSERAEFVERAEPICKTNVLANRRIFRGAKGEVKRGELKKAASHFFRAAAAFGKTIRQIDAIPKPTSDEAKLAKWIQLLDDEKGLIEKIGQALAAENKHKAQSYSVELNRNSNKANNAVLLFGFDYCRIDPSRFG